MQQTRRRLRPEVETLESRWLPTGGIQTVQHVIVIQQENHSFDNYFGTYPGADGIPMQNGVPTVSVLNPLTGQMVAPYHDTAASDSNNLHTYPDAVADINGGQMNGFLHALQPGEPTDAMGYRTQADIPNYWTYAQNFVLQDHMFEPVLGWSLPAHLLLVSGWSATCSDPTNPMSCADDPVQAVNSDTIQNSDAELYAWTDLTYLMKKYNVSWNYFTDPGNPDVDGDQQIAPGIWNPLPHFTDVHQDNQLDNVTTTDTYFSDAAAGTLPNVSWVVPNQRDSGHAPALISDDQAWVTRVVNAAMQGPEWNSTAIFVAWDDWGGYYDHVAPPTYNGDGFGLRVAAFMVSPWAKRGMIDSQTLSFDSYLAFIEDDFMNGQRLDPATDGRPDGRPTVVENLPGLGSLLNEFDFNQRPLTPLVLPLYPDSPTADAGGPYTIAEGQSLTLNATASDPRNEALSFGWDLRDNGGFGQVTGASVTLTWAQLLNLGFQANGQPSDIAVQATDTDGWAGVSDFTTVTIEPVNPSVALAGAGTSVEQTSYRLTLTPGIQGDGTGYVINWGDLNTTTVNGLLTTVPHDYAAAGTYTISASISNGTTLFAAGNALTVAVADASITASPVGFAAGEGEPFSGEVATFVDPGADGVLGEYTTQVNWGDGTQTAGTVTAIGGNAYGVSGTHAYATPGHYIVSGTILDVGGQSASFSSTIAVVPALVQPAAMLPSSVEDSAFSGAIATFTDPNGTVTDFGSTLAWGDGTSTAGTITSDGSGSYSIAGSHTYAESITYVISVTVKKDGVVSETIKIPLAVADAPLRGQAETVNVAEGTAFSGVVAAFRDPGDGDSNTNEYTVTITWGDGNTSTGTLTAAGNGDFDVAGSNTYAVAGSYPITVVIADNGGTTVTVDSSATVSDVPLQATPESVAPTAGTPFRGVVAVFADLGSDGNVAEYATTIAWGDGNTSAGSIAGSLGAGFTVTGTNTYKNAGSYSVQVTIDDQGGQSATVSGTVIVSNVGLTASGTLITPTAGNPFTGVVASFTNPNPGTGSGDYSATITWGDGQFSAGAITATSTTTFIVAGAHTYATATNFGTSVLVTESATSITAFGTAAVDAPLTGSLTHFAPTEETPFAGIVATFSDEDQAGTASDYGATINWGDGTTSVGSFSTDPNGGFDVDANHTYSVDGTYNVSVAITDQGGASILLSSPITVFDPRLSKASQFYPFGSIGAFVVNTLNEGQTFTGKVASFRDPGSNGMMNRYKVTINWGDGSSSPGAIVQDPTGGDNFDVVGTHAYAVSGTYQTNSLVIDPGPDTPPNAVTYPGAVQVLAAPLSVSAMPVAQVEGSSFSGTVATFTSASSQANDAEYSATIAWGNGVVSAATILPDSNGVFDVDGKNNYAQPGTYPITIIIDERGYYLATAQTTASVSDAPLQAAAATIQTAQGEVFSGPVVTFIDAGGALPVGNYSATVDWGDDSATTTGIISVSGSVYTVTGSHTFPTPGRFAVKVSITDAGGSQAAMTFPAVIGSQNERFITQLYVDLLHRPVDPTGLTGWTGALAAGVSRGNIVLGIEGSQEYLGDVVEGYYQLDLHRNAEPGGLAGWIGYLQAGHSFEQLQSLIVGSEEYFAVRSGESNTGFLNALYQDALNRSVDPIGAAEWGKELAQGVTRAQVATAIFSSQEYLGDQIESYYLDYLRRPADSGGLVGFLNELLGGATNQQVIAVVVGSDEYFARV
jgi:phospholipase C